MMEKTGRRTVPQIYIGDTHVGGFDDLSALDRAGKLRTAAARLTEHFLLRRRRRNLPYGMRRPYFIQRKKFMSDENLQPGYSRSSAST